MAFGFLHLAFLKWDPNAICKGFQVSGDKLEHVTHSQGYQWARTSIFPLLCCLPFHFRPNVSATVGGYSWGVHKWTVLIKPNCSLSAVGVFPKQFTDWTSSYVGTHASSSNHLSTDVGVIVCVCVRACVRACVL
jgi:hypothetical protein